MVILRGSHYDPKALATENPGVFDHYMHPVLTAIATLLLFFVPGLVVLRHARGLDERLSLGEKCYLVLCTSMLVTGWTAFVLVELGMFTVFWLVVAIAGLVGLALTRRATGDARTEFDLKELVVLGLLVSAALVAYFPPFEYVLGGRDPGVYTNAGFHVAREGNLKFSDSLVSGLSEASRSLFFRTDAALADWSQPRYLGFHLENPETGVVVPQGFHLYPVWIGVASALFEMKAGLYATPFFGILGLVGFFFAIKRLFAWPVASLAAALLCLFQLQIWFSRFPNAEIVVQFLFWFLVWSYYFMDEKRSSLAGFLAGAALGSMFLVRIETILFVIPIGACLAWSRLRRRFGRPELAFVSVSVLFAIHALIHARLFAAPYVQSVFGRWYWKWVATNLIWLALAGVLIFAVTDRYLPRLMPLFSGWFRPQTSGLFAMGAIWLVALYAYFIRPVWHGARTAPHDAEAFLRMGWYLYPWGLFACVGGLMWIVFRPERRWNVFLLTGITYSAFFFYKIRVSNDHFFGMRRFIPIIIPCLLVGAAFLIVRLARQAKFRPFSRVLAGGAALALMTQFVADGVPLWRHNEFRHSIDFMEELARHIGDDDVVIFPRREGLHLLEPPLAEMHGKQVLEFYTLQPDRQLLEATLADWRDKYQDVYFVTNYKVSLSGLFTRHIRDFQLPSEIYEYTYLGPPKRVKPFHLRFSLSKAVDLDELAARLPPIDLIDIGSANDDSLIAWFHDRELENSVSYRWTQRISSLFFPDWSANAREIVVRAAGPPGEEVPIPEVELTLNDVSLGRWTPSRGFEEKRFVVSDELSRQLAGEHVVARFHASTWRPEDWLSGASDIRDLGIRLDWVRVQE